MEEIIQGKENIEHRDVESEDRVWTSSFVVVYLSNGYQLNQFGN